LPSARDELHPAPFNRKCLSVSDLPFFTSAGVYCLLTRAISSECNEDSVAFGSLAPGAHLRE